jgi:autotransporter-associated beta strand protein
MKSSILDFLAAAFCIAFGSATAPAATWNWNGGGSNLNWTTAANWSPGSVPANDGTADIVLNNVSTLTSTANSAWSIHSLTFNTGYGSFALSGSQLTIGAGGMSAPVSVIVTINNSLALAANQTWYTGTAADNGGFVAYGNLNTNGRALTITGDGIAGLDGAASGSGSITLSGSSDCILTLFGTNSYSGGTFINSGRLETYGDSSLGAAGAPLTFNGGTLFFAGTTTINRPITLAAGGGQLSNSLAQYESVTIQSVIQGPGTLTINGNSGTVYNLTGQNTYQGGTVVENATLQGTTNSLQGNIYVTDDYAGLEFVQSFNGSYSGAISGGGGVEINTTGVVTLTGSNTYTGGTVVYQGVLQVYGSGSALPAGGSLSFGQNSGGGVVQFIGPASYNGSASWSGSGGFSAVNGKLTVNLGGAGSTFNIVIPNDAVVFGSPTANAVTQFINPIFLGSSQSAPAPTIYVIAGLGGDYAELSGQVSGGNSLVKAGNGLLQLAATNTFSGGLLVQGGAVQANDGAGLPSACPLQLDGGVLLSNGNAAFTRPLGTGSGQVSWSGSGGFAAAGGTLTVNIGGAGATLAWAGSNFVPSGSALMLGAPWASGETIFQNGLNLGSATREIRVDSGLGGDFALISGIISGSGGLNKTGSGTLLLSASNTCTGATTVSQGKLDIDGWLAGSAVSVNSGGTLSGTGHLGSVTVSAGGNLAPGDPLGALHVGGNLTLASSAVMDYELDTPTSSDEILMPTSQLVLSGQQFTDFHFTWTADFVPDTYDLIDFASTSGTLGADRSGAIDGYPASLALQGNYLVLTVVPEPSTLALLGAGAVALLGCAWRRSAQRACRT